MEKMPPNTGTYGAKWFKYLLAPHLVSIFLIRSGYTANVIAHHGVLDDGISFVQKPFSKKSLAVKLCETLKKDPPSFAGESTDANPA